jgi:hypothetical protein
MNNLYKAVFLLLMVLGIGSCTVTNNLYVNNPNPMGKGKGEGYVGLGTGVQAKIDSVSPSTGAIHFSNKISKAPVLSIGLQYGIAQKTDIRTTFYFPKIVGGFGIRCGIQQSMANAESMFNLAIGTDIGYVFSKDSIKIFGSNTEVGKETNGAMHADFFMPISYQSKKGFMLVITPRYSFNSFFIRQYQYQNDDTNFDFGYIALSLGIRYKRIYFETTAIKYNNIYYPHFGIAWIIKS